MIHDTENMACEWPVACMDNCEDCSTDAATCDSCASGYSYVSGVCVYVPVIDPVTPTDPVVPVDPVTPVDPVVDPIVCIDNCDLCSDAASCDVCAQDYVYDGVFSFTC
jgi:hypothetical protein